MRPLLLSFACASLAVTAAADEPRLPKANVPFDTAYASVKLDGKRTAVNIKLVDYDWVVTTVPRFEGKAPKKGAPAEPPREVMTMAPRGFREVRLFAADVKARDVAGNTIPTTKLRELLATEKPVLICPSPNPIDPFYLLTKKEDTIILHVDEAKLAPKIEASSPALTKFLTDNKYAFRAETLPPGGRGTVVSVGVGEAAPPAPHRVLSVDLREATDAKLKAFADAASAPATVSQVYLTCQQDAVTAAGLREVCRIASLRDFGCSLGRAKVVPADFACLAQLPNLSRVGFGDMPMAGDGLIDTVRGIKTIRMLSLNDCDVTDAGMARATEMKLEGLYVNSPRLTSAAWDSVAKLSELNTLELILCPKLTGAGLAKLKGLPLRTIRLSHSGMADAEMALFANIPTLREVRLDGTAVTDAGAQRLAGFPLTFIDLNQTKVTADGVKKLAAALPACRIVWQGGTIEPKPPG